MFQRTQDTATIYIASHTRMLPSGMGLKSAGAAEGASLQASGLVLEHSIANESLDEARQAAYVQVRIRSVRDWVVDHSRPSAIWLVTNVAWYR